MEKSLTRRLQTAYYFSLDVVSTLSFGRSLGLLTNPSRRWLVPALTDSNRYMYLEFAWPSVFKSKLAYWIRLSKLLFPQMDREGEDFIRLARHFRNDRKRSASVGEKMAAGYSVASFLETAVDPKTKMGLSEDEIWIEVLTLVRAGQCFQLLSRGIIVNPRPGQTILPPSCQHPLLLQI